MVVETIRFKQCDRRDLIIFPRGRENGILSFREEGNKKAVESVCRLFSKGNKPICV